MTDRPFDELEYTLRCALYQGRRNEFGCKGKRDQECDCGRHLVIEGYDTPDAQILTRLSFLAKLEALQAVGCVFHLNDLDRDTWNELITLKRARNWIDQKIDEQRDRIRTAQELEKKAMDVARQEAGVPPPGQSLFRK